MRKFGMEPWNSVEVARNEDEFIQIRSSNGGIIARLWIDVDDREFSDEQRENARRIVACVNACRGLPTDELERKGLIAAVGTQLLEADQLRDELLAALEEARTGLIWYQDAYPEAANGSDDEAMTRIDAAIANAKGGAA